MAAFTEDNVETILSTCADNAAALAESFSQCFGQSYRFEIGESGLWPPMEASPSLTGRGVLALFQVDGQGLAVLIPETLPLPDWYTHPTDSEKARLETLSMEWSMNLLPPDLETEKFRSLVVENLTQALDAMAPAEWAATLELNVADQSSAAASSKLLVVWPLSQPNFELPEIVAAPPVAAPAPVAASVPSPAAPTLRAADPLARLRHLPVQVSVRVAEKKIPMLQLLSITPGMLITFNKSCEDLLDFYVNNSRYGRGEAVKIGENFGLKINQVGVEDERTHKVIDA